MREVILSRATAADILQEKKNNVRNSIFQGENAPILRKNKRCTVSLMEGMFANAV